MFLNVQEFDNFTQVPLNVLELMAIMGVYLNILENIISTLLYSIHFTQDLWPYRQINTNLLYYFTNFAFLENGKK